MNEIRVKLDGEQAVFGKVPAADVARLLLLLEKAAAQAAAVVLHQPKTTTGRYKGPIEQAVHFRLVGIEEGSVVPVLELPETLPSDTEQTLELGDPTLGESALEMLFAAATKPSDPVIAKALLDVADGMHIGDRYDSITFTASPNGVRRRPVKLDGRSRSRLRRFVDATPAPEARSNDLVGVLVEADFERHTARLRTPTEAGVEVTFSEEQADEIQTALRQRSTVRGDVRYDPKTHAAKSVRLTEIVGGIEQLLLEPGEFWREVAFEDLAQQQSAGRPIDPDDLYDDQATDTERDAVIAAIADLQ